MGYANRTSLQLCCHENWTSPALGSELYVGIPLKRTSESIFGNKKAARWYRAAFVVLVVSGLFSETIYAACYAVDIATSQTDIV